VNLLPTGRSLVNRFEGRIATVIGAGSGMGRAIAQRLAAEGATVYVVDRDGDLAMQTVRLIADTGAAAIAQNVDATDIDGLKDLFARVDSAHGTLHVLHNQVGIPGPAGMDVSEQDWDTNISVNMKSMWFSCAEAMPLLKKARGKGAITLTASTSALVGSPFAPLYSMTKGSLPPFVRALALYAAPYGVRANVICPGTVVTPMLPRFLSRIPGADVEVLMRRTIDAIPLGRAAQPEEIAGVVAFLASDDAAFVTGVTLPVDGGVTIQ
jgi:NAD(P)-dependent dehydrogenase (short-subunit alcohol dehydrogenase family)